MESKGKYEVKERMRSIIIGVIALVFAIVGYQTALFVQNAAVAKILSDSPDTVYIYKEAMQQNIPAEGTRSVQKDEYVSDKTSVRQKIRQRNPESFCFNPNTVSVEDLCRLGFSQKQAQSIDNYRQKGGRFSRKSDFAKSFVVSDEIYERLEPYIEIPLLDLNSADSVALDALPGIGGWFANKIIEFRERLGGYSYKEQLMDIWKFDESKYSELEDLITLRQETITPYPLWTLPADSLRKHPYIGSYAADGIVLFRENSPKSEWTVAALVDAGIIKEEFKDKLIKCIISPP